MHGSSMWLQLRFFLWIATEYCCFLLICMLAIYCSQLVNKLATATVDHQLLAITKCSCSCSQLYSCNKQPQLANQLWLQLNNYSQQNKNAMVYSIVVSKLCSYIYMYRPVYIKPLQPYYCKLWHVFFCQLSIQKYSVKVYEVAIPIPIASQVPLMYSYLASQLRCIQLVLFYIFLLTIASWIQK